MWWKAPAASAAEQRGGAEPNFLVRCEFSHRAQVDPIVSHGGTASHIHDFFGNTTTNANSTYDTLRAGGTTCSTPGDKSAYWIPTVKWIDSNGNRTRLTPSQGLVYYRLADKAPMWICRLTRPD